MQRQQSVDAIPARLSSPNIINFLSFSWQDRHEATCCITSFICDLKFLRFIILFSVELTSVMVLMDVAVVNTLLQYFP